MPFTKFGLHAVAAVCLSAALAGCGGGGGGGGSDAGDTASVATLSSGTVVPVVAPPSNTGTTPAAITDTAAPAPGGTGTGDPAATPATPTPPATPATRPDLATATLDEIAAWNAACETDACRIALPPRSGRSLTWWGTDPRLMEQVNDSCGPQPDCRVPDGDLLVWNFDCTPQPTCRIRLSQAY